MSDSYSSHDPSAAGGQQPYGPPPGGQQPYGPPPGGQQPYGWPGDPSGPGGYGAGGYGYAAPPPPKGTNGFAIAGLVLGIVPILAGILGIVFGAIGLKQTKRTGQNGRGLAIAGIVLGSIWLVLSAIVIAVAIADGSGSSTNSSSSAPSTSSPSPSAGASSGSSSGPDSESAFQVTVGECLRNTPSGEVRQVDLVSCSQPHAVEAYSSFQLSGSSYPGDTQVSSQSESGCKTRFPAFVGTDYDSTSLDVYFLHPTQQSWTFRDDREVLCLVGDKSPTTGSLRGAHR